MRSYSYNFDRSWSFPLLTKFRNNEAVVAASLSQSVLCGRTALPLTEKPYLESAVHVILATQMPDERGQLIVVWE
jgi:hypothetical protein